ncbi:MAG: hypothetical protein LBT32_03210 [Peptococcaceae bacterium]|jgi:hypothetical protein|nr:hypothetical protein [Peptococcaceae bacterium]
MKNQPFVKASHTNRLHRPCIPPTCAIGYPAIGIYKTTCKKRHPPKDTLRKGCINIIASIAMTETSIAHILNAEGEKIQKMLELSSCSHDIFRLNESVNHVVTQLTQLEQTLCAKLEMARELLCYTQAHEPEGNV